MSKLKIIISTVSILLVLMPLQSAIALSKTPAPISVFAESGCGSDGEGHWAITTSINFGCQGAKCQSPSSSGSSSTPSGSGLNTKNSGYCYGTPHNAMIDLLFAIIKFISDGIGLIIIMSLIIAGIQYTFSRGEPQAINSATRRIQSSVTALVIFIFAYAILNFLVPNGLFGQ